MYVFFEYSHSGICSNDDIYDKLHEYNYLTVISLECINVFKE